MENIKPDKNHIRYLCMSSCKRSPLVNFVLLKLIGKGNVNSTQSYYYNEY
jgi:hypothetical protein